MALLDSRRLSAKFKSMFSCSRLDFFLKLLHQPGTAPLMLVTVHLFNNSFFILTSRLMFHHHDETNGPYQRKVNKSMDNIPIRPLIKKCAFNSEQMEAVAEAGGWIERSADTSALQSRLRVLSWSMSTALMECIKLSSDDAERTTPVYRGRRNKEIKAPHPTPVRMGHTYTQPQLFQTWCDIIMQICDSDMLFCFSLSGTLMRACIDGSSGKRCSIWNTQTHSDVTAF